jgi:hypothetical protein
MPIREFRDSDGRLWRVWGTIPDHARTLGSLYETGWLTFESGPERRRLAPIPAGWEEAPPDRLGLLCGAAKAVTRRTPTTEVPALDLDASAHRTDSEHDGGR